MSWRSFVRRRQTDADLQNEIAAFLDEETEENIARGLGLEEARRQAYVKLGNPQRVREDLRAQNTILTVEGIWRDVVYGGRMLSRSPGFAATAVLTLAIALAANTAVFSLIDSLLLRPLPVPQAGELAVLRWTSSQVSDLSYNFSAPMFRALEKRHDAFQTLGAFAGNLFQVRGSSGSVEVPAMLVSGDFFRTLETQPLLGRYLMSQDDRPGGTTNGFTVVISENFWRSWFNGASDVIGRRLIIDNAPFTVVGVMPSSFIGADPTRRSEIYAPLWAEPVIDAPYSIIANGYKSLWLRVIARRSRGLSLAQSNAALGADTNSILEESVPDAAWVHDARSRHFLLWAESGSNGYSYLRTVFFKPLVAVFSLSFAMLLLACMNLASLLMARSYARERELATRLALGASRTRLLQQLLVESLLIAILGTAAAAIAVPAVTHSLASFVLGNNRTAILETAPDMRVFGFVAIAAVIATLVIGLIPALRATSKSLNEQIKAGSQTTPHGRRRLVPQLLMGIQVALALVLVVGAGLLTTSLARLYRAGLGFNPHDVINLDLAMGKQPLDGTALLQWYQSLGDRLMRLPGVRNVSFAGVTPMSGSSWSMDLRNSADTSPHEALANDIAPAFFQTMHIRLISGRDFRWNDNLSSGRKIILSRTAAERLFPKEFPIGQHVIDVNGKDSYEVIGVVDDIRYASMRETAQAEAYLPITQREEHKPSYTAVVRLFGGTGPFASGARSLLEQMSPGIPAPVILPLESDLDASISSERMMAVLAVFFAACSLLVTAIGLYGTLAYATSRRTSEIGIRMALGAEPQQIVALIFQENAWIAACGSAFGLVVALLASRALVSFLYDTSIRDPWVLLGSVGALILIASVASIIPAVRAARLEPVRALRVE